MEKGNFLYIDKKKKRQLIVSAFSMGMVAIICISGIIITDTNKSLFAVLAALASLPAAKLLVGYLVLMPYKSIDVSLKEKIENNCGDQNNCRILYDVLLSSTEKAMYAGLVFVKNGKIYSYTNKYKDKKSKIKPADIEKHIKSIIESNCNYSAIKVYEDEDKFLKAVNNEIESEKNLTPDELEKMRNMNERIEKQIKVFMF